MKSLRSSFLRTSHPNFVLRILVSFFVSSFRIISDTCTSGPSRPPHSRPCRTPVSDLAAVIVCPTGHVHRHLPVRRAGGRLLGAAGDGHRGLCVLLHGQDPRRVSIRAVRVGRRSRPGASHVRRGGRGGVGPDDRLEARQRRADHRAAHDVYPLRGAVRGPARRQLPASAGRHQRLDRRLQRAAVAVRVATWPTARLLLQLLVHSGAPGD